MKNFLISVIFIYFHADVMGQYSLQNLGSQSGLLFQPTSAAQTYSALNYNIKDSRLGFTLSDVKLVSARQARLKRSNKFGTTSLFNDIKRFDLDFGFKTDKNKSTFLEDDQLNYSFDIAPTFSHMWEQYRKNDDRHSNYIAYYFRPKIAIARNNFAQLADPNSTTLLLFSRVSTEVGLTNGFEFSSLKEKLIIAFSNITSVSRNGLGILKERDIINLTPIYSTTASTPLTVVTEKKRYFGAPVNEVSNNFRLDANYVVCQLFPNATISPILGLIGSTSYKVSDIFQPTLNFSFGPTIQLNGFPSQIVTAILLEFSNVSKNNNKPSVTTINIYAGIPFKL